MVRFVGRSVLRLPLADPALSASTFFQEPSEVGATGLLWLFMSYGYVLYHASNLISEGSELLLLVPSLAGEFVSAARQSACLNNSTTTMRIAFEFLAHSELSSRFCAQGLSVALCCRCWGRSRMAPSFCSVALATRKRRRRP